MLEQLEALYQAHGLLPSSLLRLQDDLPTPSAYARRFGSLDFAFQQMFVKERDRPRQ